MTEARQTCLYKRLAAASIFCKTQRAKESSKVRAVKSQTQTTQNKRTHNYPRSEKEQNPMFIHTEEFAKRLRNQEFGNPTIKRAVQFLKRIGAEEAGITALETAIILIAFVVVASVFAFTMLSAGTFSTERGKETIYSGLQAVQSSMELKGGIIGTAITSTQEITSVTFTLANVLSGQPINLATGTDAVVVVEYRDANQRTAITDWTVKWLGDTNGNDLLETGEMAELTVPLGDLTPGLGPNTTFVIEVKPPTGAVLNLQRTTPAYLDVVNDLQ
jgi:flagellin FlaB